MCGSPLRRRRIVTFHRSLNGLVKAILPYRLAALSKSQIILISRVFTLLSILSTVTFHNPL